MENIDKEKFRLKFISNFYLKDSLIHWTYGGHETLGHFIDNRRIDSGQVIGPPKKQGKWNLEQLDTLGALGLYSVVPRQKKTERLE